MGSGYSLKVAKSLRNNIRQTLRFERFLRLVETNKLTFTHPARWREDDPYEDLIHWTAVSRTADGRFTQDFLGNEPHNVFISSWSLLDESAAMWKLYGNFRPEDRIAVPDNHLAVQVTVSIPGLVTQLGAQDRDGELIVAPIEYLDSLSARERTANLVDQTGTRTRKRPEAYLFKRKQFAWEREVRLLWIPEQASVPADSYPALGLSWPQVCRQVLLDPRASPSQLNRVGEQLGNAGLDCAITKSGMYEQVLLDVAESV